MQSLLNYIFLLIFFLFFGGGRIRTHGPVKVNGFQDRRNRPALPLLQNSLNFIAILKTTIIHETQQTCRVPILLQKRTPKPPKQKEKALNRGLGFFQKSHHYLVNKIFLKLERFIALLGLRYKLHLFLNITQTLDSCR